MVIQYDPLYGLELDEKDKEFPELINLPADHYYPALGNKEIWIKVKDGVYQEEMGRIIRDGRNISTAFKDSNGNSVKIGIINDDVDKAKPAGCTITGTDAAEPNKSPIGMDTEAQKAHAKFILKCENLNETEKLTGKITVLFERGLLRGEGTGGDPEKLQGKATFTIRSNANVYFWEVRDGKAVYTYDINTEGRTPSSISGDNEAADNSKRFDFVQELFNQVVPRKRYAYDSLNRLITETTDRGIVSYTYDAISRITERRINGSDSTTYVYDKANRIRTITYRNKSVLYDYDIAGRLIKKTLPNGVAQEYNYDEANQLLSITYTKADGTVIDVVSYTYDENSNRITRNRQGAGSVTETPFTATYAPNNRMLTYNGYPLTYDDNGNLISRQTGNGTVAYNWDAKNQLISINGPNGTASFRYDAQGRRIEKTINGQTTSFLYDGPQAIAELQGSAIGATYHTGLQIDEVLARYTNTGNRTLLADALGSVIALTDDQGQTQTTYAYSPFGEVSQTGEASDNSLQYTGRENDNTGLDYYRARYYDPQLKRFISEDPIGLVGGINLYAYVGNNPVNQKDPLGLWYVDINVSGGYIGGGTAGVMINDTGIYPYIGGGLSTPGVSVSTTWSPNDPTPGLNVGLQGSGGGYAGQIGIDPNGNPFVEVGAGGPSGVFGGAYYVFGPYLTPQPKQPCNK